EPGGAFAAWNASSTTFVRVELDGAESDGDDVGTFVEHDYAARTSHSLGFRERIEIEGYVAFVGLEAWRGGTTGNDRFQFFAIAHAAADFVDKPHERETHRHFIHTRFIDVPGDAHEPRAAVFWRPKAGIPFDTP